MTSESVMLGSSVRCFENPAGGAGKERADDIRVGDVGQLGALLRESPDVVPE